VPATSALTIADGIAVKRPGNLTLELLGRWVDDVVIVGEDETAAAMVVLMERCKLVVEGAGAVGVAALLGGQIPTAASGTTVAVLSGGNVDPGLLASIARRHETLAGRRLAVGQGGEHRPLGPAQAVPHGLVDVARLGECPVERDGGAGARFRVELPLAMPVIFAGLRVATVSNIALVSVAAVVGGGALGRLFDRGLASRFYTPLIVGLVLSVLLALLADALILLLQRTTLPWARGRRLA